MNMRRFLVLVSALALVGCTDEVNTRRTLDSAGYSDIRTTGYEYWMCGEHDNYSTGFIAKNPAGKEVSGAVCCGAWAKGCTIRF